MDTIRLEDPQTWVRPIPESETEPTRYALRVSWREAAAEARAAYRVWRRMRDGESYAVYRACADRADAAQDALAATS
jgi:hypothetical protein